MINAELVADEEEYLGESAYRKPCQYADLFYENVFSKMQKSGSEDLAAQLLEIKKERQKVFDERTELARILRMTARREALLESIREMFRELEPYEYVAHEPMNGDSDTDLLIHLTDIHTGININNAFNSFNEDVLHQRLGRFIDEIKAIKERHKSKNCSLVIGETISGLIHPDLRVQSNENIIQQFRSACTAISHFVLAMSRIFDRVDVYVTPGNHSRLCANKNDSIKGENLDILLIDFLMAVLHTHENVQVHENTMDPYVAVFKMRGLLVAAAHGDKDSMATARDNFTRLLKQQPDIILLGHLHHTAMDTDSNTRVIQSGSLSGTDEFAVEKRLYTDPEQTVAVIGDQRMVCLYPVNLK